MSTTAWTRRLLTVRGRRLNLEINVHDTWIGCYWMERHWYICPLPCLVLHAFPEGKA